MFINAKYNEENEKTVGTGDKGWPPPTVGRVSWHQNNACLFDNVLLSVSSCFWYKNSVNPENYKAQCLQFCFVLLSKYHWIFKEIDYYLLILFGK